MAGWGLVTSGGVYFTEWNGTERNAGLELISWNGHECNGMINLNFEYLTRNGYI